jgi:hypothetical protein
MSSLTSDKDIRRAARKLRISEKTLRDRLPYPDRLLELAASSVSPRHPIETVAEILGISEDKIAAELSRQEKRAAAIKGMGLTVYNLLENPPS